MKNHLRFIFIWTVSLMLICSCGVGAKKAQVWQWRYLPTGIDSHESIVIMLNNYQEYFEKKAPEGKEIYLETCMKEAIEAEKPRLNIVSASAFRKALVFGKQINDHPRSAEAFLSILSDKEIRDRVAKLGIRYLVIVDMETYNSDKEIYFDFGGGGWGVGQKWTNISDFRAYIVDAIKCAKSGDIGSKSVGEAGYIVPVIVIIPLPPIPYFSMTESKACSALGKAVHKFILEQAETTPQ